MARLPLLVAALLIAGTAVALVLTRGGDMSRAPTTSGALAPDAGTGGATDVQAPEVAALQPAPRTTRTVETAEAPGPVAPTAPGSELTVEATDAATGRPVARFFVTAIGADGATSHAQGRDGLALVTDLAEGGYNVEVQGPEHAARVARALIPASVPLVVALEQRPGLRGVVRFADARPAANVVLRLTRLTASDGAEGALAPTMARSDAQGRYRFVPLAPGRYAVSAEHLGREVPLTGEFEVEAAMVDLPDVRLEAGARLELEALDAAGLPRAKALLVVAPAVGEPLRRYTDEEGRVILEPLAPGEYTVTLPAQAGEPQLERKIHIAGGLHREVLRAGD